MGFQKGNKNGMQTRFGAEIDPREAQLKGAAKKRDNAARMEWFENYTNLALELASLPTEEFEKRFAHPTIKAEEILLCRFSDPTTAYFTLKDFQERVQGKPRQEKDVNLSGGAGLSITVNNKEEAQDLDNLL